MTLRTCAVDELMDDLNGELYVALGQLGRLEIDSNRFSATFERLIESRMTKISQRADEVECMEYLAEVV